MRVYRIEREKYLKTTLSGVGAALTEGYRCNSLSTFLVYTAESRALALLEISVHLDLSEDLPTDRFFVEIDIPEDIRITDISLDELPENWDAKPPLLETQYIGDDFVAQKIAAVLKVTSSIVPPEYNYLINPNHPDATRIRVVSTERLQIDNRFRLWKAEKS